MVDFIVVGQGLAGSVLALQLLARQKRVVVFDTPHTNVASNVASGLYNPIAGKDLRVVWQAETVFERVHVFYQQAQAVLNAKFFHPTPIFRPFLFEQERQAWLNANNHPFVARVVGADYHREHMVHPLGGLLLKRSGWVDVPLFLSAVRRHLQKRGVYRNMQFVCEGLEVEETAFHYDDLQATHVVFCQGPQAVESRFFPALPFRLVRGETVSVRVENPLRVVYNRRVFVLPKPGGEAVVGSTYEVCHNLSAVRPTPMGLHTLQERLERTFRLRYTFCDQRAGIRPATLDRKPLLGRHPQHPRMGVLNGLGSKGVSLAPYLAEMLIAHLLEGAPIPAEVGLSGRWRWQ